MPPSFPDLQANDDLALRLWTTFREDGPGGLNIACASLREADIALAMQAIDADRRQRMFLALPPEQAAEVLEEFEPEIRDELFETTSDDRLISILRQADADDAVYFLEHLDEERCQALLSALDAQFRARLAAQFELPEDSAGRLMQRKLVALNPFNTAQQAIERVRGLASSDFGAIYIINTDGKLLGTVSLREVVFARPNATLGSFMTTDLIAVNLLDDEEEVARLMQRYHLIALPVVDDEGILRGIVTWDDAADVIEAEVEEDILAVAGTGEDLEDNEGTLGRARHRLPYLLITTLGGFVMASMIDRLGAGLSDHRILIAFMPLIPALAGNVGIQCSTVTLRSIVNGEIRPDTMRTRALREISTGTLLAVVLSLLSGLGALIMILTSGGDPFLAAIITGAMIIAVSMAACFGVIVPLLCDRLGIDPAIAAGPFITMLNDIGGMGVYIATATALMPSL